MSKKTEFGSWHHLAVRFFGALDPRGPSPVDETWATGWLLPGEIALWRRMSGPDRRHAAGVAREVASRLAPPPDGRVGRGVMAAALLHDVGKVESGLGTFARVAVTLLAMAVGRERIARWDRTARANTWRQRAGSYVRHDGIGADLLRQAGSDPLTVAWAGEHHLPTERWSVPRPVAVALKEADGD